MTQAARRREGQAGMAGAGHGPVGLGKENVEKQLEACFEAPFYTLGPLITDISPAYGHIASTMVATNIGWFGTATLF